MINVSHLHPMLVHFPVALLLIGFIAELAFLYFKKTTCLSFAGFYLLIFGALAAAAAVLTGELFTSEMSGTAGEVKGMHELFASVTLWTALAAAVLRIIHKASKKENAALKWTAFILYAVCAISVSITGFYGGTLVYNYMMPL